METPLFPLTLYIYDEQGYHDGGIQIVSEEQLNGLGTIMIIRYAIKRGVEVRMTDPMDLLVFHAKNGKIVFPPPNN